jgi:soluble lytic murein transglycosylase-like protein
MNRLAFFPMAALLAACAGSGYAQSGQAIYLSYSASGSPVYTHAPRSPSSQLLMQLPRGGGPMYLGGGGAAPAAPPSRPTARTRVDSATVSLVRQASARHGIDFDLLMAVIRRESAFNHMAVSRAGARGAMQLMPGTAARYGVTQIHDPGQNIAAGSAYLRDLLDMFGRVDLALAAYNAGEGAVMRYGRQIPPYAETQHYVRTIMADYARLKSERE